MVKFFTKHNETIKTSGTIALDHLLQTSYNKTVLEETQAKIYKISFYKELFPAKRSWPNIHTKVSFLSIWVRDPEEESRKKLFHMISYLHNMPNQPQNLRADRTTIVKW